MSRDTPYAAPDLGPYFAKWGEFVKIRRQFLCML